MITRTYNYHCCKCKRPSAPDQIENGVEGYHQLCKSCHKDLIYRLEDQWWWHKECYVCLTPMEETYNIDSGFNICSEECKYAFLAVRGANDFTHIPTRIWSYCKQAFLFMLILPNLYFKFSVVP